ncbi:hypothetical protein [Caballeronia sp. GACF4]|jgi:hypothetical protein|uniref:hypothetical protein n=1 Tax=Caballeronia sp. GACF4 TaxID=2921763 RepID=UPI0020287CE2|nr:hypothetical protein [Caballeronia sp. GACF4]
MLLKEFSCGAQEGGQAPQSAANETESLPLIVCGEHLRVRKKPFQIRRLLCFERKR